jgi:hypothetical protein
VKTAPLSVLHTIADHYRRDARDFLERFNLLWEAQLHKTGRIKSFVDLLFACECVLKVHIILGRISDEPTAVYNDIRRLGHDVGALADAADFLKDRVKYQFVKDRLGPFSVFVRYSLDAYETFFPSAMERVDASIDHSKTIGSNPWVLECRDHVSFLLESTANEFQGFVTDDLSVLVENELRMKAFVEACMR